MSFKKDMKKNDYIYLDLRYKLQEIADLENKAKNNGLSPELKTKINRNKAETVKLIKLAALNLGIKNVDKIQTIDDFNKFPKLYNWMFLTNNQNNETSAALFLKEGISTEMNKQELSATEYLVLKKYGLEYTWDTIQQFIKGNLSNDIEDWGNFQLMRSSDSKLDSLVQRLSRRNDYIESANISSEKYLNQKTKITDLRDLTPELISWVEYRTTLPQAYIDSINGKPKAQKRL